MPRKSNQPKQLVAVKLLHRSSNLGGVCKFCFAPQPWKEGEVCSTRTQMRAIAENPVRRIAAEKKTGAPLKEFALKKRCADCPVCQLPRKISEQLRNRNRQAISIDVVVEWLLVEHGIAISRKQFIMHSRARHGLPLGRR